MPILSFFYFAIWFGGAFWSVSGRFLDAETAPKVYWALFGAALFSLGCVATAFSGRGEAKKPHFIGISAAIVLCAVSQAVYALLQWSGACPSAGPFPACGSFDNPAGLASALAFSLPFGLHLAENCQRPLRSALCVAMALTACAILASGSRSGMLAMGAVLPAYLLTKRRRTRSALFLTLLAAAAAVAAAGLYHYKKDSADGRLLIWQCTWELIKESPWTGHGPGGFQAHYMEAQADYFRQHPDSPYARLADDVKAPFNEYLGLWTNFGLTGLLAAAAVIALLHRAWRRHSYGSSLPAALCLLSVGVFSMFSYPFRYPHTWMFTGLSAAVLLLNAYPPDSRLRRAIAVPAAFGLCLLSAFALRRMQAEIRWCDAANRSFCGQTEQMLPIYAKLYTEMKDEPLFLYNYAAELNVAGRYSESLHMGKESERRMADYPTQLLLADNCRLLGHHDDAERHLWQAAYMCPNRFVPLYELHRLYKALGDTTGMCRTADAILRKPVKVDSPQVRRIIAEMKRFRERLTIENTKDKSMNADDQPSHASHVQVPTPKCAISPSASTQRNKTGPIQISLKKRENAPWNALFSALTDVNSTKL